MSSHRPIINVTPEKVPNANTDAAPKKHEAGAISSYGLLVGALLGGTLGWFLNMSVLLAVFCGGLGWFAGALWERSRS